MTWPLFAVLQSALFTAGVTGVFVLRNRALKARIRDLETQGEAPEDLDLGQEVEHLRAANQLLLEQLEETRASLARGQDAGQETEALVAARSGGARTPHAA